VPPWLAAYVGCCDGSGGLSLKSQLEASLATSSSLAQQVKEGVDREAAMEAEVRRLKEQLARAALAPLSGSEEL
jgi:cell division protein FtsB